MKSKVSPTIVGMFVLGAISLALIAILSFGGVNFFSKPQRFAVFFDESIHGLDLGSAVKLRGVRVGRVVDLTVRYDARNNRSVVEVICEFTRSTVKTERGALIDVSSRDELQRLIDAGLRAQLGVLGLATGQLFVELDFVDPGVYPVNPAIGDVKYAIVPSVPSAISEFQASLSEILASVQRIDFAGISRDLGALLVDLRKQVAGADLARLSSELTRAARSVNDLARSPEIPQTFANLNGAIDQLKVVLGKIDGEVKPTGDRLAATLDQAQVALKTFADAAESARRFISAQSGLGEEAARSLNQLGEAAASVQRLADFLERNPNALISGKKAPR